MKRIFYRLEEDLYFDWDGFVESVEESGINAKELEGTSLIREGETYPNKFNRLVHVN